MFIWNKIVLQKLIPSGSVIAVAGGDSIWYMQTTTDCMPHEATVQGLWLKTNESPNYRLTVDNTWPHDMTMRSNMLCVHLATDVITPNKLPFCRDVSEQFIDKAKLVHQQFLNPPDLLYPEVVTQRDVHTTGAHIPVKCRQTLFSFQGYLYIDILFCYTEMDDAHMFLSTVRESLPLAKKVSMHNITYVNMFLICCSVKWTCYHIWQLRPPGDFWYDDNADRYGGRIY